MGNHELNQPQAAAAQVWGQSAWSERAPHFGDSRAEYEALTQGAGLVDCALRTLIELTGDDRASFLHNLSTNEIRKLAPGAGCELFLLNAHGKILGHAFLFCGADSLILDTAAGQSEKLLNQLNKYLIREKVEIVDRTADWADVLLAGPHSSQVLEQFNVRCPVERLAHDAAQIHSVPVTVCRVDWILNESYVIRVPRPELGRVLEALCEAGAVPCGSEAAESARIESAMPLYGIDITERNLPQEVGRDRLAISFVKGCYLGQETVARIDALGHVNRLLTLVRFDGRDVPPAGTPLAQDGHPVGEITSAAWSMKHEAPLALAYVRTAQHAPGTRFDSPLGPAESLPLPE